MKRQLGCLSAEQFEQLVRRPLPRKEAEALAMHLEKCPRCAASAESLLQGDAMELAMRQSSGPGGATPAPGVAELITRLKSLVRPQPAPAFLVLACSGCAKKLKVKPELAGKKIKCPECGRLTAVPGSPTPAPAQQLNQKANPAPSVPPERATGDERTLTPNRDDLGSSDSPTLGEAVHGNAEAWDFLAPAQQPDELGRLGGYRVLEVLGQGGMGVVFRAEDPQLERLVALKAMLPALAASPSARKRFLREAKAAAAIKHDHIVAIYQVGEDRGAPYLAMEFLEGESLDDRLRRDKSIALAEVLRIGREMAAALAAAHERDLIHRDIKPANVWLETRERGATGEEETESGTQADREKCRTAAGRLDPRSPTVAPRVKILDFGLARSTADTAGLTQEGAIIGTPSYMAPEQASGQNVDHRCDLFSLGCVLYRMTTGELPFRGSDTMSILASLALDKPKSPRQLVPGLPPQLSQLIDRLLAKDAKNRPASAREVEGELTALERELDAPQTIALSRPRVSTSNGRRKLALVACGLLGLAALVLGVVFFLPTSDGRGTIRVEINDPTIEVVVNKDGLTFKDADKQEIRVVPGNQKLKVKRGDMEFETDAFVLKNETVRLSVSYLDGKLQVVRDGKVIGEKEDPKAVHEPPTNLAWKPTKEQQKFIDGVALLPEDKRAEAVRGKLLEACGNADGGPRQPHPPTIAFEPKEGLPTKFVYSRGYPVDSIWPIAALTSVKIVEISAAVFDYGPLSNLPLTDVKLRLILDDMSNERYLKRIKTLKTINGRPADDFWAARGTVRKNIEAMNGKGRALTVPARKQWLLEQFRILYPGVKDDDFTYDGNSFGNKPIIQDVTPLRGVGVVHIGWEQSGPMSDLRQLSGTGLQSIACGWACDVRDLSALKGLPLKHLSIHGSMVADLSPLAGMKLESFECYPRNDNHNGPFLLADLTALKGMPLKKLNISGSKVSDLSPLLGMPLTELDVSYTPVTDLTPLTGLPLRKLNINPTGVTDIAPLAGMKLSSLRLAGLPLTDLSPLAGMQLDSLSVPAYAALSTLEGVKVKTIDVTLRLYFEPDEKALRALNPEKINGKAPADFWKDVETRRGEDADLVSKMAKTKVDPESLKAAFDSTLGGWMNTAFRIEEGKVVELTLETSVDLKSPRNYVVVQAFPSLRKLTMRVTPADLSPLLKLPGLEDLECPPHLLQANLPVLRALPKLKTLNGKPAKDLLR